NPAGNIPRRIQEYCKRTGQKIPQSVGEIIRCINESLAMKYRIVMEEIEECTGKEYSTVYMVGGGIQSKLLCQFTANACHKNVSAGPVEATVLGNIALQLMSSGDITSLSEARKIIAKSQNIETYQPEKEEDWQAAFEVFK
ncbi:MAG: FGGY-family carbohydrate kinase, partial [Lachnospiraceae bacterium]